MIYGIYQPMKYATAKSMDILKEALASEDYAIQLKRDGASYVWAKDANGSVHLYGDKFSRKTGEVIDKIDNVPHLKEFAEKYFPNESAMVVEMCAHYNYTSGQPVERTESRYVNGVMLCTPSKATERQLSLGPLEAYAFDLLFWGGEDYASKDFEDRDKALDEIYKELNMVGGHPRWFAKAETIKENKADVIAGWLAAGEEGGVLKLLRSTGRLVAKHHLRSIGETAARPMHVTYKIKQVDTVDVVIMGIEMPTKEYTGKDPENYKYRDEEGNPVNRLWYLGYANAFVIGVYAGDSLIKIGTVASGLDDATREQAALHPDEFVGAVIEVDCMSIDKAGRSLRHPRLMRFRPDKDQRHCTTEIFD